MIEHITQTRENYKTELPDVTSHIGLYIANHTKNIGNQYTPSNTHATRRTLHDQLHQLIYLF